MRRFVLAGAAALAIAGASLLAQGRAEAMPLASGLAGAATGQTENVALVCRRVWNGFAWVRDCYRTGPAYYAPRYYAPRPYYRPYYRPRYYY